MNPSNKRQGTRFQEAFRGTLSNFLQNRVSRICNSDSESLAARLMTGRVGFRNTLKSDGVPGGPRRLALLLLLLLNGDALTYDKWYAVVTFTKLSFRETSLKPHNAHNAMRSPNDTLLETPPAPSPINVLIC